MGHRVKQICGQVFRFAAAAGQCDSDPTSVLKGAMQSHTAQNYPAITAPLEVGRLMCAIDGYAGVIVRGAMFLQAYTWVRPGEARHAEWSEIDWENKKWDIPAEKMKLRRPHSVPLAEQVVDLLQNIRVISGKLRYVFPSARAPKGDRPLSETAVLVALRSMGYEKTRMCAHGFRSMASTLLNENGWNSDWIEMQLAHAPKDTIRGTYNCAKYWDGRVEMMQWYADYLDRLRDGTA